MNIYGIVLSEDDGKTWTDAEKQTVLGTARDVERAFIGTGKFAGYAPGQIWKELFGTVNMLRSSINRDYGGHAFAANHRIEFYDTAFPPNVGALSPQFRNNVVHEIGHLFNGTLVNNSDGKINPYNDLTTAINDEVIPGGVAARTGMKDYPWEQNDSDPSANGELYADMFLNWVYGSFESNTIGTDLNNWMSNQMNSWVNP